MDTLLQDLRYAFRMLLKTPTLTVAAIVCLGLGIGANSAIFGIVDRLLFRPPAHVRDAAGIQRIYFAHSHPTFGNYTNSTTSFRVFHALEGPSSVFASVAAVWGADVSFGRGPEAQQVRAQLVSASYFPLLGVQPALGRFFGPDEDRLGGPTVAVLGYAFWHHQFADDSTVLGRDLDLGRGRYTVVGVAPDRFTGVGLEPVDVWLPIRPAGEALMGTPWLTEKGYYWIQTIARLAPTTGPAQAEGEATLAYRRNAAADGERADSNTRVLLGPIQQARGPAGSVDAKVATWVAAVAMIVLLIACANVANLLLARAVQRQREIAVRLALGAGRGRLARQLLTESALLAVAGGGAAVLVALWVGPLLRALLLPAVPDLRTAVDGRVLAFTAGLAALTGLLSGLAPAIQASRPDLAVALKAGAGEGRYQHSRTRTGLLIAQVALTLMLLAGAGLFVRSLRNVRAIDIGMEVDRLLVASMDLRSANYPRKEINALYDRMLERVRALPGVTDAAVTIGNPFGWSFATDLKVPGLDSLPRSPGGGPYINYVSPDYFSTLGMTIKRGRGFTAEDRHGGAQVAVVGEAMARRFWPTADPIGRCLLIAERECSQVVGIVADAKRDAVIEEAQTQYYVPLAQWPDENSVTAMYVRTAGSPDQMAAAVRREMQSAAPDLPFAQVQPLADVIAPQLRPWRMGSLMFSLFGALALALAAVGLYGVLAYSVTQRTHEIGVRIALGAERRNVLGLVIGHGLRVVGIGVLIGAVGAIAGGRALKALLYGVSPADPLVLAAVALVLLTVALAASWLPARRATKVDPMVALRYE